MAENQVWEKEGEKRGWEHAVNAFRVDFDCDIYITGSNAWLLSSELSTYLSGRYVEIRVLPLSFREFLEFHGYTLGERELAPLRKIRDNYEKMVIALECGLAQTQDGIKIVKALDFLLE